VRHNSNSQGIKPKTLAVSLGVILLLFVYRPPFASSTAVAETETATLQFLE
jgi:hypothetical protein